MKKKMSTWKLAVLFPVIVGFFFIVACQDQVLSEMSEVAANSMMAIEIPAEVQVRLDELKAKDPNANFVVIEMNADGKEKVYELQSKYGALETVHFMAINDKDDNNLPRQFLITDFNENAMQVADQSQNDDVFTIVEETASFPEGMPTFFEFIKQNFKYPAQARNLGVEGKVFVQFVVEKDGKLSNFQVLKGIGAGCDAEAIRVLGLSKNWKPATQRGKAVRQKMVIPITFKLNDKSVETGSVEPVNKKFHLETIHEKVNGTTVVKGIVKDEAGNPLPGMNVILNGTSLGTVSDLNGTFRLDTKQVVGKVSFSFVGYETQIDSF